jgi:hypothetical protein
VIAPEISPNSPDFGLLGPVAKAALAELVAVGVTDTPGVLVADAGYRHQVQMQHIINSGTAVLIPPDASNRTSPRPGWDGGLYAFMRRVLDTNQGGDLYRKRKGMIEPVFGNTKSTAAWTASNAAGGSAVRCKWRLITATHNLLKLHAHQLALAGDRTRLTAPDGLSGALRVAPLRRSQSTTLTAAEAPARKSRPSEASGSFAQQPPTNRVLERGLWHPAREEQRER